MGVLRRLGNGGRTRTGRWRGQRSREEELSLGGIPQRHFADIGGGSGGLWTEDANSPGAVSGQETYTVTLDGAYDLVLLDVRVLADGSNGEVGLTLNGDSGANYDYTTYHGRRADTAHPVAAIAHTREPAIGSENARPPSVLSIDPGDDPSEDISAIRPRARQATHERLDLRDGVDGGGPALGRSITPAPSRGPGPNGGGVPFDPALPFPPSAPLSPGLVFVSGPSPMAPFGPVSLRARRVPRRRIAAPADPDPDPAPTDGPPSSPGLPGAGGLLAPAPVVFPVAFFGSGRLRVRQRAVRGAPTQVAGRRRPRRRRGRWPRPPDRSLRLPAREPHPSARCRGPPPP